MKIADGRMRRETPSDPRDGGGGGAARSEDTVPEHREDCERLREMRRQVISVCVQIQDTYGTQARSSDYAWGRCDMAADILAVLRG
jgi:hypothetical protein